MSVPEATVDQDDRSITGKNDVWSAGEVFSMQAKAEPHSMESRPYGQFGLRIFSLDPGHHSGPGLGIDNIAHLRPGFIGCYWYPTTFLQGPSARYE